MGYISKKPYHLRRGNTKMYYIRGMKYVAEIRIIGDIYQDGKDYPVMVSEIIDPIVKIRGNDIESILRMMSILGELSSKTTYTHGKENKKQPDIHREGKVIGVDICRN